MSTSLSSRPRIQVAAACVVAAVVVLPSAFLAWRAPTTTEVAAAEADVRHEVAVSVVGIAERASSLYPEGRSEPVTAGPDGSVAEDAPALLRSQIDELLVRVDHEVVGAGSVSGAGRVDVVLVTGRGFELELNGVRMQQFTGTFDAEVTLALDAIDERFDGYLEEAELSNDSMVIEVRPLVATDDGVTVSGEPTVINPQGDDITVEGPLRTVATAEGETATVAATAPLVGVSLPVPVVRVVGTGIVLGLLLLAGFLLRRELEARPDLRIGLLHGSLLVDIEPDANVGGEIVRVTSIAELTRLAKRDQRTILHQEREGGRHHYLVPDGDLTYEYVVDVEGQRAPGIGLDIPDDASTLAMDLEAPSDEQPQDDVTHEPTSQAPGDTEDVPPPAEPEPTDSQVTPAAEQEAADEPVVRRRVDRRTVERLETARHGEPRIVDVEEPTGDEPEAEEPAVEQRTVTRRTVRRTQPTAEEVADDTVRDYLPVTPADLPRGRVVMVEDFTELLRIWMQDNTAPGRLQQRRLAHGGMRYSVVRNGREFVYEASADEGVTGVAPRGSTGA